MIFRNNKAVFLWGFAALFLTFVAVMTYVLIRDGASQIQIYPPCNNNYYPPWFMSGVLTVFWLAGCGFAVYAARRHCLRVAVLPDRAVSITWRYPFKSITRIIQNTEMSRAQVLVSRDDEGSPYFHARIVLADGAPIDIGEGHNRELCENVCVHFNTATGKS